MGSTVTEKVVSVFVRFRAPLLSFEIRTLQERWRRLQLLPTMIVSTAPDSARQSFRRHGQHLHGSLRSSPSTQVSAGWALCTTMQVCTPSLKSWFAQVDRRAAGPCSAMQYL
jgi:hypothetical protein